MATKTPTIPLKGEFPCPVIDPAIDPSKPNSKKHGAKSSPMQAYNTPIILATDITPNDLTMCIVDPLYQLCFINPVTATARGAELLAVYGCRREESTNESSLSAACTPTPAPGCLNPDAFSRPR